MKFFRLFLLIPALLAGWPAIPAGAAADYRPLWIDQPKSDDSIYLYRVGTAVAGSETAARQAALIRAGEIILDEILAQSGVAETGRAELRGRLALRDLTPVPDAVHYAPENGGIRCWLQVSLPLQERDRLRQAIAAALERRRLQDEFDARINGQWQEGRAASLRGEYTQALALLREAETNFAAVHSPAFAIEELRLLLGDVQRELGRPLDARGCYETVAGLATDETWQAQAAARLAALPDPPRLWPALTRWQGRAAAQVCVLQPAGEPAAWFDELAAVLHRDFQACRHDLRDLSRWPPESAAQLFTSRQTETLAGAARDAAAGIVLVIYARGDKTNGSPPPEVGGLRFPAPDMTVQFMVLDAIANRIVYAGEFREMRGRRGNARLAERIASILINNYLAPKCPALAPGLEAAPPGPS